MRPVTKIHESMGFWMPDSFWICSCQKYFKPFFYVHKYWFDSVPPILLDAILYIYISISFIKGFVFRHKKKTKKNPCKKYLIENKISNDFFLLYTDIFLYIEIFSCRFKAVVTLGANACNRAYYVQPIFFVFSTTLKIKWNIWFCVSLRAYTYKLVVPAIISEQKKLFQKIWLHNLKYLCMSFIHIAVKSFKFWQRFHHFLNKLWDIN